MTQEEQSYQDRLVARNRATVAAIRARMPAHAHGPDTDDGTAEWSWSSNLGVWTLSMTFNILGGSWLRIKGPSGIAMTVPAAAEEPALQAALTLLDTLGAGLRPERDSNLDTLLQLRQINERLNATLTDALATLTEVAHIAENP